MDAKKGKGVTSWIFVYAVLIAAVVFAAQSGAATTKKPTNLSPVILGGEAPTLKLDAVVRRSDI